MRPRQEQWRPLREERPLPPLKRYPQRFYDYYPGLHIGLPRAPAFRGLYPSGVSHLVPHWAPSGKNLGLFKTNFNKSPRFVPFGDSLVQFGTNVASL